LLRGRLFEPGDVPDGQPVAVISQSLARKSWPDQDPIGQRIQFGNMDGDLRPITIVGVVGDVRENGLDAEPSATLYVNVVQRPLPSNFSFVARSDADSAGLIAGMRSALREVDPETPASFRTLAELFSLSLDSRRFSLVLFGVFASVALALAITGIYGVTSFTVARRTQEIGVRMALGAERRHVLALVLGHALRLAAIGIAAGLAGAVFASKFLASLLYGVSPTDPTTLAGVSALLLGVAIVACLLPARRATRVDPLVALRAD
jgi:predicted permease